MGRRYELSDVEWEKLAPFLPSTVTGGRPRWDDRRVLNGIVWRIRAGAAWRDLPARYGSWQSVYARFRRWALDGTFTRMLAGVQADADAAGDIDWLVSVDSTIVWRLAIWSARSGMGCRIPRRRIDECDQEGHPLLARPPAR